MFHNHKLDENDNSKTWALKIVYKGYRSLQYFTVFYTNSPQKLLKLVIEIFIEKDGISLEIKQDVFDMRRET